MSAQNNSFILVCGDADSIRGKVMAFDVAKARLRKKLWPIFTGTRNRKAIQKGDTCFIYLAGLGEHSQHIFAKTSVIEKLDWYHSKDNIDDQDLLINIPDMALRFEDVEMIEPVPIRKLLSKLSFIPDSPRWGSTFQGGCRKLNQDDADLIFKQITQKNLLARFN